MIKKSWLNFQNVIHMGDKHSFFLPDLEYLIDLEGLLKYLGAKIGQGHLCIWCNERKNAFQSLDAVRKHMQVGTFHQTFGSTFIILLTIIIWVGCAF